VDEKVVVAGTSICGDGLSTSEVLDFMVGFRISGERNRQGIGKSARDVEGGERSGTLAGTALCIVEWTRVEVMIALDKYQEV